MHHKLAFFYGLFAFAFNALLFFSLLLLIHLPEESAAFAVINLLCGYAWVADFLIVGFGTLIMAYALLCTVLDYRDKEIGGRAVRRALFGALAFAVAASFWLLSLSGLQSGPP